MLPNIPHTMIQGALHTPLSAISGKNGDITQNGGEFVFGPGQYDTIYA